MKLEEVNTKLVFLVGSLFSVCAFRAFATKIHLRPVVTFQNKLRVFANTRMCVGSIFL